MLSLSSFPNPPPENSQTICERNSSLVQRSIDLKELSEDISFPSFFGSTEKCKLTRNRDLKDPSPFIQSFEPLRVQLIKAWSRHGLTGILTELASLNSTSANPLGKTVSGWMKGILKFCRRLQSPHLAMSTEQLLKNFSQVQNWDTSNIRYMAWHPHTDKMAIALRDDELLIKEYSTSLNCDVRTLRLASQKQIVQLAWRPFSASDLAVACSSCIIIWHVQPFSLADNSRSAITATNQILSKAGHCPISSIAWTPSGDLLISCSPLNRCILVWNTSMEEAQVIRCTSSTHLVTCSFSSDHLKLLTTTTSNSFHVWESKGWRKASWGGMEGMVGAHAWSPDGLTLLFTPSNQPVVYSLVFLSSKTSSDWLTVTRSPSAVLSLAEVEGEGDERVGGLVHLMAWDPHGERLAISFKGSSSGLIAVYQTRFNPVFKALPRGFVRGMPAEKVCMMAFKAAFVAGSLLSIAWSSGRISHVPFYYKPALAIGQLGSRGFDLSTNQRPTIDELLTFDGQQSLSSTKVGHDNDSLRYRHRSFDGKMDGSLVW